MKNNSVENEIIIYDGVCVLCNKFIIWILNRDKTNLFNISSLESNFTEKNFPELKKIDSVAVIKRDGKILQKSKK